MNNCSKCVKRWSSFSKIYILKGAGGSPPVDLIYFNKPSQILSWNMVNFALSGPIFKILNRTTGEATNK